MMMVMFDSYGQFCIIGYLLFIHEIYCLLRKDMMSPVQMFGGLEVAGSTLCTLLLNSLDEQLGWNSCVPLTALFLWKFENK